MVIIRSYNNKFFHFPILFFFLFLINDLCLLMRKWKTMLMMFEGEYQWFLIACPQIEFMYVVTFDDVQLLDFPVHSYPTHTIHMKKCL